MPHSVVTGLIAGLLALVSAPAAIANVNNSSNWAGYAIHRSAVKFRKISAVWTEPTATCRAGHRTYSAFWVGLGGFSQTSRALEQIGTELDCTASGNEKASAWYELVPAPSRTIRFAVHPGDTISASVSAIGHRVSVALYNETAHRWFRRTVHATHLDVTSAEWIAEAPSACTSPTSCRTLPLADFGRATFSLASAQAVGGHVGAISDRRWRTTKIRLTPGGRRFVVSQGAGQSVGTATPSALTQGGSQFTVTYSSAFLRFNPVLTRRRTALRAAYLEH